MSMLAKLLGLLTASIAAVEGQLGQDNVVVIDNNPPQIFAHGHVPGAINLDPGDFTQSNLPANKNATLIFYCSGPLCPMAPGAAKRAWRMGYRNVAVMSAGISGWLEEKRPVEKC